MTVLYIIGGGKKAYGAEQIAMSLIKGLSNKGIEFIIVTANSGPVNTLCNSMKITNYTIPFSHYVYKKPNNCIVAFFKRIFRFIQAYASDIKAMRVIEKYVDLSVVDVVYTNISRNLLGARISDKYNIKHIWHIQELFKGHYGLEPLFNNQLEWMNNHCTSFIAISDAVRNSWVCAGIDKDKIHRIYNGIDVDKYTSCSNSKRMIDKHIRIVMVAELCEAKGQMILLKALDLLDEHLNEFSVDFYGDGKEPYFTMLKKYSEEKNINAIYHGFIDDISSELNKYDIGVVCSKGEGFGISTLEYMVAGLCVIATDSGANRELIKNESMGYIFDRNNIKRLSEILIELSINRDSIIKCGKHAKNFACKEFTLDKQITQIKYLLEE